MRKIVLSLSLLSAVACDGTLKAANKALTTAEVFSDKTVAGFVAWDRQHQKMLVDQAADKDAAKTAIGDYYKKREAVITVIRDLDSMISMGEVTLPMVEAGLREKKDFAAILARIPDLIVALNKALGALGVTRIPL